jgi:hypothetical protein
MSYRFNVTITEQDYIDFNDFILLKSSYGKKQTRSIRALIIIGALIIALIKTATEKFARASIDFALITVISGLIACFLILPIMRKINKLTIKDLNKRGKPCYSPSATLEFNEEDFTETTTDGTSTVKYSAVETVYLVNGKDIYILINKMMAHILTESAFDSPEQYSEFATFLSSKIKDVKLC